MLSVSTTRRAKRGMVREWRLHALSVFSLAVAFVCLGAALLVVTNLRAAENRWAHAGRASMYLKDGASQDEVDALRAALVLVPGVTGARYVSSGDARKQFGGETEGGALAALPPEAFPASIEIDVAPDMPDMRPGGDGGQDAGAPVGGRRRDLPVVDGEALEAGARRRGRGGPPRRVVFASVLAVVGSTMRLVLQRRRMEVEVLKLVGATDGYVRKPFVVEGSVQGALGATAALGLLGVLFLIVRGGSTRTSRRWSASSRASCRGRSRSGWSCSARPSARRRRWPACGSWWRYEGARPSTSPFPRFARACGLGRWPRAPSRRSRAARRARTSALAGRPLLGPGAGARGARPEDRRPRRATSSPTSTRSGTWAPRSARRTPACSRAARPSTS